MQKNSIEYLEINLFKETDGNKFARLKEKLIKTYGTTETEKVLLILMKYAKEGQLLHWRNFLLTDIIELVPQYGLPYADFFEWTLTQPELAYWGIDGLLKTKDKESYEKIVELVRTENMPVEVREKGIKSISIFSKQTFDRLLPSDPGSWRLDDLRVDELLEWQQNGYKEGRGHIAPKTHPSLDAPKTPLEKTVSKINKKLEIKRAKHQDLSNPTNWLAVANEKDMKAIHQKWTLPEVYWLFLQNFSPINVCILNKNHPRGLNLYGANKLIIAQQGYSYNPLIQQEITDWPANFVVIADSDADPFCIDIRDENAPIYTSVHGIGKWKFELYADSFMNFLKELV